MSVANAYKLAVGVFKQDPSNGSVLSALSSVDSELAKVKWGSASILPKEYDFTNLQIGDVTVETVEKNTITALTKSKKFDSGALTPPTITLASVLPVDCDTIVKTLDELSPATLASSADPDPYKVLFLVGAYNTTSSGTRTYNAIGACVAILTTDGGRQGEAKASFTGSLGFQACHVPLFGASNINANLTWNEATGAIAWAAASQSNNS